MAAGGPGWIGWHRAGKREWGSGSADTLASRAARAQQYKHSEAHRNKPLVSHRTFPSHQTSRPPQTPSRPTGGRPRSPATGGPVPGPCRPSPWRRPPARRRRCPGWPHCSCTSAGGRRVGGCVGLWVCVGPRARHGSGSEGCGAMRPGWEPHGAPSLPVSASALVRFNCPCLGLGCALHVCDRQGLRYPVRLPHPVHLSACTCPQPPTSTSPQPSASNPS